MERHEIIELMGQLKLAGMRAAYDEVITAGLRAQHSVQRIIGELLLAQLADNARRLVPALDAGGHHLVIGRSHAVELEGGHQLEHIGAFHHEARRKPS